MNNKELDFWNRIRKYRDIHLLLVLFYPLIGGLEFFVLENFLNKDYLRLQTVFFFVFYVIVVWSFQWKAMNMICPRCGKRGIENFYGSIKRMRCINCSFSFSDTGSSNQQ